MHYHKSPTYYLLLLIILLFISCNDHKTKKDKELVLSPESIDAVIKKNIKAQLLFAADNKGRMDDSLQIIFLPVLKSYYESNDHNPLWSRQEKWRPQTIRLLNYLNKVAEDGLYKEYYHFWDIDSLKRSLDADSLYNPSSATLLR